MTNKYAGNCVYCGSRVPARGGNLFKKVGPPRGLGEADSGGKERKAMKDQYGQEIPGDLVVLEAGDFVDQSEISDEANEKLPDSSDADDFQTLFNADWYEAEGHPGVILVSTKAVKYLSEFDPLDAGIDISDAQIRRIADSLKRFDLQDGFTHA